MRYLVSLSLLRDAIKMFACLYRMRGYYTNDKCNPSSHPRACSSADSCYGIYLLCLSRPDAVLTTGVRKHIAQSRARCRQRSMRLRYMYYSPNVSGTFGLLLRLFVLFRAFYGVHPRLWLICLGPGAWSAWWSGWCRSGVRFGHAIYRASAPLHSLTICGRSVYVCG